MRKLTLRNAFTALVFLSLFSLNANSRNALDGQFITIEANGVSDTYPISKFQKVTIENASSSYPTLKVDFSDGVSYVENVRNVKFIVGETLDNVLDETYADIKIYSEGNRIIIDAPQEYNISFYDVAGRQLGECVQTSHCECVISLVGVYIVRVGDKQYKIRTN